jgi:hypothetical protein
MQGVNSCTMLVNDLVRLSAALARAAKPVIGVKYSIIIVKRSFIEPGLPLRAMRGAGSGHPCMDATFGNLCHDSK